MIFKIGACVGNKLMCEIQRPLAVGNMSELYLARPIHTEWKVVIKAAKRILDGQEQYVTAYRKWKDKAYILRNEAALLETLRYPGIPELFDFAEEEDCVYYVMPYYEKHGCNGGYHEQNIFQDQMSEIIQKLCGVLAYLQERPKPIVHGDIKPDNIIITKEGGVVLLDFGTAIVLDEGQCGRVALPQKGAVFQGTFGYAAPECWKGEKITPAADMFSVGATLYYWLEGKEPRKHYGQFVLSDPIKKNRWQPVLDKCTALNLKERYQSAAQLYEDLKKYVGIKSCPQCGTAGFRYRPNRYMGQ